MSHSDEGEMSYERLERKQAYTSLEEYLDEREREMQVERERCECIRFVC